MAFFYFDYYCVCEAFLFNSRDISRSILSCGENYLFIDDVDNGMMNDRVYHNQFRNTINCEVCHHNLGGYISRYWEGQPGIYRFIRHRLFRKCVFLYNQINIYMPQSIQQIPITPRNEDDIPADPVGIQFIY